MSTLFSVAILALQGLGKEVTHSFILSFLFKREASLFFLPIRKRKHHQDTRSPSPRRVSPRASVISAGAGLREDKGSSACPTLPESQPAHVREPSSPLWGDQQHNFLSDPWIHTHYDGSDWLMLSSVARTKCNEDTACLVCFCDFLWGPTSLEHRNIKMSSTLHAANPSLMTHLSPLSRIQDRVLIGPWVSAQLVQTPLLLCHPCYTPPLSSSRTRVQAHLPCCGLIRHVTSFTSTLPQNTILLS